MQLFTIVTVSIALAGAHALVAASSSHVDQLADLRFERGSAQLRTDEPSRLALRRVAAWAHDNPDALIVLDGHADDRGSSPDNVRLSLKRAQTVRDQLVDLGVNELQIVIAAYGETGPNNHGNRRVVVWGTRPRAQEIATRE